MRKQKTIAVVVTILMMGIVMAILALIEIKNPF